VSNLVDELNELSNKELQVPLKKLLFISLTFAGVLGVTFRANRESGLHPLVLR
jgi:hypothetical protein